MKKLVLLIVPALICGIVLMTGCEKQKPPDLDGFDDIIGCWADPVYEYDYYPIAVIRYKKVETLPDNSPSIKFLKNGTLTERKNAGWCATPPIAYKDFSGNWRIQNENIIIDVGYWGGKEHRTWEIINVTNTSLTIEVNVENTQYREK